MNEKIAMKERNYSMDILRIISMMMIITLHLFTYSNINKYIETLSVNYFIRDILKSICIVSVNCYILISGYFGEKTSFKASKLVEMLIGVVYYSIIIYTVCLLTNKIKFDNHDLINVFLPTLSREYWFVTCYVGLYIMSPILKKIFQRFSQKEMFISLIIGFLLFVLYYNFFFFCDNLNFGGATGIVWFSYIYMCGMYIKKYVKKTDKRKNIKYYLISLLGAMASKIPFIIVYLMTKNDIFLKSVNIFDGVYNSIFVFICSLTFFNIFSNFEIKPNSINKFLINFFAKTSFSVYLIHDNKFFRNTLWGFWSFSKMSSIKLIITVIFIVGSVYLTCSFIDVIKQSIFKYTVSSEKIKLKIDKVCLNIESRGEKKIAKFFKK